MELSLTNEMKDFLKDCYNRELEGDDPCNPLTHKNVSELLIRNLITLKAFTYKSGERKAAYFLTDKGRKLVEQDN